MGRASDLKFSIVVSLYNEEKSVSVFWADLHRVLQKIESAHFQIIWVNDGSTDNTQSLLDSISAANHSSNVKHMAIEFSKNFGHEAAMLAGIDHSSGSAIICMDVDGQHPPDQIPAMVSAFINGADIVLMEREKREDNGWLKNRLSKVFYQFINYLSEIKIQNNSSDFFLISNNVAEVFKNNYREKVRFIRGFIQSVGFHSQTLKFDAPSRLHGESKYSYLQLVKLAFNALFSFSNKPLRLTIFFSIIFVLFTFLLILYSLYKYAYGDAPPSGYTTIVLFLSISFSFLFVTLTVISLYFEKIIEEMRQRPLYIIKSISKK